MVGLNLKEIGFVSGGEKGEQEYSRKNDRYEVSIMQAGCYGGLRVFE
jgi:hypothetical protein